MGRKTYRMRHGLLSKMKGASEVLANSIHTCRFTNHFLGAGAAHRLNYKGF